MRSIFVAITFKKFRATIFDGVPIIGLPEGSSCVCSVFSMIYGEYWGAEKATRLKRAQPGTLSDSDSHQPDVQCYLDFVERPRVVLNYSMDHRGRVSIPTPDPSHWGILIGLQFLPTSRFKVCRATPRKTKQIRPCVPALIKGTLVFPFPTSLLYSLEIYSVENLFITFNIP